MELSITIDSEVGRSDKLWLIGEACERIRKAVGERKKMMSRKERVLMIEGKMKGLITVKSMI